MSNNKLSVARLSLSNCSRPIKSSIVSRSEVVCASSMISRSRFVKSRSFGCKYWARFLKNSICALVRACKRGSLSFSEVLRASSSSASLIGTSWSKKLDTDAIMSLYITKG